MAAGATTVLMALAAGTLSVMLGLLAMRLLDPVLDRMDRMAVRRARRGDGEVEPLTFLIRDQRLIDASAPARRLLDSQPAGDDWSRLTLVLSRHFGDPGAALEAALTDGTAEIVGSRGLGTARLRLSVQDMGERTLRLTLVDPAAENAGIVIDSQSLAAMEEELAILRESVDHAPVLIWREEHQDTVSWVNGTYLREVEAQLGDEIRWPMPRLIDLPHDDFQGARRARIEMEDQVRWFDCHVQAGTDHRMIFAVPADNAVRAEQSLREFIQTLTKTFADLPIGLAIFDKARRLQLFNPALIDLTGLATGFLTARPTLYAVLDALRESRMVPEPKDYRSWRDMMANLETAAASGHHVETWSLPGGQTYRVTGRPHPDGAIAFLFEDITSEMALTRRFRAELSLGAEVLDTLSERVAIFEATGRLAGSNRAYRALWGEDLPQSLRGHIEMWRGGGEGPGHDSLRQALMRDRGGPAASGAMALPDGALAAWRVQPLSGGRRLVIFDDLLPAGTAASSAERPALGLLRAAAARNAPATQDDRVPAASARRADKAAEENSGETETLAEARGSAPPRLSSGML